MKTIFPTPKADTPRSTAAFFRRLAKMAERRHIQVRQTTVNWHTKELYGERQLAVSVVMTHPILTIEVLRSVPQRRSAARRRRQKNAGSTKRRKIK